MNSELSNKSKMRLYLLTSLSCFLWLIQVVYETVSSKQDVFSIYNVIFYISLMIVIAYTSYSAYSLWQSEKGK